MSEESSTQIPEKKPSWRDKTLKAAGYSYMLGDISMVGAGMARGRDGAATVKGAIIWFLGGVAAAIWGSPKPEKQLQIQASKLEQHLTQKGAEIPDEVRGQSPLLKKKTLLGRVSQFLYEHPSEMLNAAYAIGAAILLHGSLKKEARVKPFFPKSLNAEGLTSMNNDFWIGALVLAGASTGLLVKEDPEARQKAEGKGFLQKAYAWVAEKPLRVTGVLYGLNNVFLGANALTDYSQRATKYAGNTLKPHLASTTQLGAYLFSNLMLFLSRRDQVSGSGVDSQSLAQLENAAAHIIAAQTPEKQKALLTDVSEYMAQQKGVTLKAPEIAQQLANRITMITQERLQSGVNEAKWVHREAARQHATQADLEPVAVR